MLIFSIIFQDLVHANEEFASEVEKLYKAEEEQIKEREILEREMKELEERLELEKSVLILKHQEEKEGLETQVSTAVQENDKLSAKNKSLEDEISCSHEVSFNNILDTVLTEYFSSTFDHHTKVTWPSLRAL